MSSSQKFVLVTGAGRGLGLAFVRELLHRGHCVVATARRPSAADDLQELAAAHKGALHLVPLDVEKSESLEELLEKVGDKLPRLDWLINNAGINSGAVPAEQKNLEFGKIEPRGILRMVHVNAVSPIVVAQTLLPLMRESNDAKVLSVSSWLGSIGNKKGGGNYGYCTSKAALNMMSRAMAFDLAKQGVICAVANPGWVKTDMGGARAKLTPQQSVSGLLDVLEGLVLRDAGRFFQWDGTEHPW